MAKVHKSFRFDEEIWAGVSALAKDGETEAATFNRVLSAGVASLMTQRAGVGEEKTETNIDPAFVESLQAHIGTLKESNATLTAQLETKDEQIKAKDSQISAKDEQIRALSVLTAQAQELHGAAVTKTIDQPQDENETGGASADGNQDGEQRRGWWARLWS